MHAEFHHLEVAPFIIRLDLLLSLSMIEHAKTTDDFLSGLDPPLILEDSEYKKTEKNQKF